MWILTEQSVMASGIVYVLGGGDGVFVVVIGHYGGGAGA